jgi:hypothetical protein
MGGGNGGPEAAVAGGVERSGTGGFRLVRGFRGPGSFRSSCVRWVGGGRVPVVESFDGPRGCLSRTKKNPRPRA